MKRNCSFDFLSSKGVSLKRSAKGRNSTSSNFLPNYSLSSWRKLYRRSSTSHCLFLMRGCAKNPPIFIGNRLQKLNFSIFWGWHGKIKNLNLKIIFLWIFNFETNSEQHFSCTLTRSSENLAQIINFSWNTIDFTKFSDVHQKCEKLWKFPPRNRRSFYEPPNF